MIVAELAARLGLSIDKKSWSAGNDLIAGMGKALAVWAGYKVVGGLAGVVDEVTELGGRIDDLAQATGIGREAMQELGYAAKLNGSDMEGAIGAVKKFSKGIQEAAATGKGPVADGLRAIGLSVGSVASTVKREGLDAAIEQIADKIVKMPDGSKKAAAAMDIFGRSGADLIPLLNSGGDGIRKLREEAQQLGVVMSDDDVKSLADFGDDVDRVKASWQGIKQQAITALLPALQDMTKGLLEWLKANRELVRSKLQSLIGALAGALRLLGSAVAFVVDHWELFTAALVGVGVVTAVIRLIKLFEWLGLASTRAAAMQLAAWAVAAAPFVLVAAFIAAVALALTKYRKQAKELFVWLGGRLAALIGWFKSLPGKALSALSALGNMIKDKIISALEAVKKYATELWDYIKSLPGRAARSVKNWVLDKVGLGDDDSSAPSPGNVPYWQVSPTPQRPITSPSQVTNTYGDINVTTPATDPTAVGSEVRKVVREEWDAQMRHAHPAAGGQ